jgi:hypothetical protein
MTVRLSTDWTYRGLQALIVENRELRVVVLPELGGKIWSILAKRHDREMLWHHPRMPLRPVHYGATYDNWFTGGWDEVFPNDYPVTIGGEDYPDHGEVWSLPATWVMVERSPQAVSILLENRGIALNTRFRKTITLRRDEPGLRLRYEITNESHGPLDVHWKMHPALPLRPGARLHLPARRMLVDPDFADAFAAPQWDWPHAPMADGTTRDMRTLPDPVSGDAWFFYGLELEAGYCAVSYPGEGLGFGLTFDPEVLTSTWIFATFGGWRDLSTIILEPCTGYRAHLDDAIAHGSALRLDAGATVSSDVTMSLLGGADDVAVFERDGGRR